MNLAPVAGATYRSAGARRRYVAYPAVWETPVATGTSHSAARLSGQRVLVVAACADMADLLSEVFEDCGATVATANSAHAAVLFLHLGAFDLVVLDLHMPRTHYWHVLNYLQQALPDVLGRTILLTDDLPCARRIGATLGTHLRSVGKPFDLGHLRRVAGSVLRLDLNASAL